MDPSAASSLEDHVKECDFCRSYEAFLKEANTAMKNATPGGARNVDWDEFIEKVSGVERLYRRGLVRVAAASVVLLAVGLAGPFPRLLSFAAGGAILIVFYLLVAWLRARKLSRIGADRSALLDTYRKDLRRSALSHQVASVFCALSAVGWLFGGLYLGATGPLMALCFLAAAIYLWWRCLKLRREHALLG